MANRDAKLIERTLKDFSLGAMSGEGGGGTTVVANPELVGDEPDLTGLEVDGAKYKVPQGGSSLYTYYVETMDIGQFTYSFTFQCDNPELDSYDKLLQYLLSKGYYIRYDEEPNRTPILGVSSDNLSRGHLINGLFVGRDLQDELKSIKGNTIYVSSGELYTDVVSLNSDNFKITLVTE